MSDILELDYTVEGVKLYRGFSLMTLTGHGEPVVLQVPVGTAFKSGAKVTVTIAPNSEPVVEVENEVTVESIDPEEDGTDYN